MSLLPTTLTFIALLLGCAHSAEPVGSRKVTNARPNIVFVLVDDLGFHDVGYHGSRIHTPTIDRLSADGVRLENYYVQPSCSPTRCSIMSGRYLIHEGIQHSLFGNEQSTGLPLDSPTLPDKLREAGYATHHMGKWHLGFYKQDYMPNSRGFDSSFGFLGGHEGHYDHKMPYKNEGKFLDLRDNGVPATGENGHHSTYMYTQRASEIIKAHNKTKPLFLYMAYQAPHNPLEVPDIYEKPYQDIYDRDRRSYAGLVSMMDQGLANLTQVLKDTGLWDNTLLVFSTDNGGTVYYGGNNYPLRGWKFSLWEGGIRGIGFVTGGKNIKLDRGAVRKQLMHVSDWFPTLVGVAGGSLNGTKPLDGVDQWKSISTGAPTPRKWLLHNIDPLEHKKGKKLFPHTFDTRVRAAIRVGDYKLITGYPGNGSWIPPPEMTSSEAEVDLEDSKKNLWLFNLVDDPKEKRDLSKKEPERVNKILDLLVKVNATSVPAFFPPKDPQANPKLHGGVWGPWA